MRKYFFGAAAVLCLGACTSAKLLTINNLTPVHLYETLPDDTEKKILRGIISPEQITQDTTFGWYAENLKFFKADSGIVKNLRAKSANLHIVIFGGTWCHDTQQVLPKYLTLLQAANFPADQLTLIGTNRAKTTLGGLHKAFGVSNVPTLIVISNGKEVGRIVEFGNTGLPVNELGDIISKL